MIRFSKVNKDAGKKSRKYVTQLQSYKVHSFMNYTEGETVVQRLLSISGEQFTIKVPHKWILVDIKIWSLTKVHIKQSIPFSIILMDKWEKSDVFTEMKKDGCCLQVCCHNEKETGVCIRVDCTCEGLWPVLPLLESLGSCSLSCYRCNSLMSLPALRRCDRLLIIQGDLRGKEVVAALRRRGYKSKRALLETPFIL